MAVQLLGARNVYTGLSTDTKPTDSTIPVGSTFTEVDTGQQATWSGTTWFRQASPASGTEQAVLTNVYLSAMLNELVALRQLTELANELEVDDLDIGVPVSS